MSQPILIPNDVFIAAADETTIKYKRCADNWGEEECCFCRKSCGEQYQYVETDWIRRRAGYLRRQGLIASPNSGAKRKKWVEPTGKYAEYLRSPGWRQKRQDFLQFWDHKCCLCNSDKKLEVHHRHYNTLGHEGQNDCVVLCHRCHMRVHGVMVDGNEWFNKKWELFDD